MTATVTNTGERIALPLGGAPERRPSGTAPAVRAQAVFEERIERIRALEVASGSLNERFIRFQEHSATQEAAHAAKLGAQRETITDITAQVSQLTDKLEALHKALDPAIIRHENPPPPPPPPPQPQGDPSRGYRGQYQNNHNFGGRFGGGFGGRFR